MRLALCLILCFTMYYSGLAQDSAWKEKPTVNLIGFMDVYYTYDFNKPSLSRQRFFFNHNRHNEFNLNLGLIGLQVEHKKYRANLAFQAGTYALDNYPNDYNFLNEANIGLSLNKKNNLWLDAGIFSSHLGFESALSIDNPTLTRSFLAESSPYFLTGVKLSYQPSKKWDFSATICNGWQAIERKYGNSMPGFGSQVVFKPIKGITINWSTYVGSEYPDDNRRLRIFNDIYGVFSLSNKFKVIAGFDHGQEQVYKNAKVYNTWYIPVLISEYKINEHWKTALRFEYVNDKWSVVIPAPKPYGFQVWGASLNIDYLPTSNIAVRLEARHLQSNYDTFQYDAFSSLSKSNFVLAASLAIKLKEKLTKSE